MEVDLALLDAARRMNADALAKIFDLYWRPLYKYAYRLCTDALLADQIVGDVFAKLLDQFSSENGPRDNLRSYLFTMTYHRFVSEVRHSHRRVQLEVVDFLRQDGPALYRSLENRTLFEAITQAIRNDLTNLQRHVIILRFFEGFSLHKTAEILGKSIAHVKVTQHRAIATLRQALDYQVVETSASSPALWNFLAH